MNLQYYIITINQTEKNGKGSKWYPWQCKLFQYIMLTSQSVSLPALNQGTFIEFKDKY